MAMSQRPSGCHKVKALETLRLERLEKKKNVAFGEG